MSKGKRVLDVTICLLLAVPACLAVAFAALIILGDTGAKPLFRQRRVGQDGRPFTIFKLRTMRLSTPDVASHRVDAAAAITPTGRVLRRFKIDELPQIANVMLGHMSLIGPRPCLPSQRDVIASREKLGVTRLVPGITGPAQIAGVDMSEPDRLAELDATYLGPWSLTADLKYLLRTVRGAGTGDAALASK